MKKIGFIRDLCDSCYTRYRDDLAVVDYLLIEDQKIDLVFFNSGNNILRQ